MYQDGVSGFMTAFDRCDLASTCMVGRIVGVIDFQTCLSDADGDGAVGIGDVLLVLAQWGPCSPECLADIDGDGTVGILDFLSVLAAWGPCP
jgi:hypothetical protein